PGAAHDRRCRNAPVAAAPAAAARGPAARRGAPPRPGGGGGGRGGTAGGGRGGAAGGEPRAGAAAAQQPGEQRGRPSAPGDPLDLAALADDAGAAVGKVEGGEVGRGPRRRGRPTRTAGATGSCPAAAPVRGGSARPGRG